MFRIFHHFVCLSVTRVKGRRANLYISGSHRFLKPLRLFYPCNFLCLCWLSLQLVELLTFYQIPLTSLRPAVISRLFSHKQHRKRFQKAHKLYVSQTAGGCSTNCTLLSRWRISRLKNELHPLPPAPEQETRLLTCCDLFVCPSALDYVYI